MPKPTKPARVSRTVRIDKENDDQINEWALSKYGTLTYGAGGRIVDELVNFARIMNFEETFPDKRPSKPTAKKR